MPPVKKPAKPKVLTVEQILAADDLKTETVPVPEWGGSVVVRAFTGNTSIEMSEYEGAVSVFLLSRGVVDPVIDEDTAVALMGKSMIAVHRVVDAINRLNASDEEAIDAAEARFLAGAS